MVKTPIKRFLLAVLILCCGCASSGGLEEAYSGLNISDGVNMAEAAIVAQKELKEANQNQTYKIKSAEVIRNLLAKKYPDFWFVSFKPRSHKNNFWRYLIVINKNSGKVIYSDAYVPLEIADYDWVFKK